MANLDAALDFFVDACLDIEGINAAHRVEPVRLDVLPAVTLKFLGGPQEPQSTGGYFQIDWLFRCSLTISATDLNSAQNDLFTFIPLLYAVIRQDTKLGGNCDWALLNDDRLEEPIWIEELRGVRKNLYLTIRTSET